MPTAPVIGFAGLKTSGNQLNRPLGSASVALNIVSIEAGVTQPRRGHWHGANTFGNSGDRAWALTEFGGGLVVHYGPTAGGVGDTLAAAATPTGSFSDIAAYAPVDPTEQRMKFVSLAKSLYWNAASGMSGIAAIGGAARLAGPPKPGDFIENYTTPLSGNPGAGWLPVGCAVGYRVALGRKDANGVVKLSAPNGLLVVINPADLTIGIGGMVRTGGTTVTITPTLAVGVAHNVKVGDVLTLAPGEANFAAGNYSVTAITSTTVVVGSWAGANVANTVGQTMTSGTKNVGAGFALPTGMGTAAGDFAQLYRTLTTAPGSIDPGDECLLAYERTLTAADVAAKAMVITDTTPDSFLGAPLYTNSDTGLGIAFAHVTPPLMHDVCVFDGRLFGGQTQGPHSASLRLLGTGSPNGLVNGDLLAIDGTVYTVANVVTDQNPTVNIRQTCSALAFVFNYTGTAFTVTQLANGIIPSGQMVFARRGITGAQFAIGTSRPSAFQDAMGTLISVSSASRTAGVVTVNTGSPHGLIAGNLFVMASAGSDANFPVGIKTVVTTPSTTQLTYTEAGSAVSLSGTYYTHNAKLISERLEKAVRFSQPGEPEAWPIVNFLGGLPELDVLRVKALRSALYIFFKRGDIYECSGSYPYSTLKFCGTATLVAPDTLIEHNERLYALTTQGIVAISASGVEILSRDIEAALRVQQIDAASMLKAFAVAYEMDRQYQLWLGDGEVGCSGAYVHQSDAGFFTQWEADRTCGLAIKNDSHGELLVFGAADINKLRFERKEYDEQDFLEDQFVIGNGSAPTGWNVVDPSSTESFYGVWGPATNDVWAVGTGGTILHWNGTAWSASSSGTSNTRTAVFGVASNDVWVVGVNDGQFQHWNGSAWSTVSGGGITNTMRAVHGSKTDDIWAVGDGGEVYQWNGAAWSAGTSGTAENLNAVFAFTSSNVWAAGANGTMLHWTGAAWAPVTSDTADDIVGLWGAAANDIWAITNAGAALHFDGAVWTDTSVIPVNATGIWGVATDDIWVTTLTGHVLNWDGLGWNETVLTLPMGGSLDCAFGAATDDFWGAGATGTFEHYTGALAGEIVAGADPGTFEDLSGLSLFSALTVGDLVTPSGNANLPGWVTAINGTSLETSSTYTDPGIANTLTIGTAIEPIAVKWMANSGGAPGIEKQWREGQLHFGQECISTATITVTGERQTTGQTVAVSNADVIPLGIEPEVLTTERFGVPIDAQRQAMLEVELSLERRAQQYFKLLGVSLTAEGSSEKTPKGGQ